MEENQNQAEGEGLTVLDVLDFAAITGDFVQRLLVELRIGGKSVHVRVGCADLTARLEEWKAKHPAPRPPVRMVVVQRKSEIGQALVVGGYKGKFPAVYDLPQLDDEAYKVSENAYWLAHAWHAVSLCMPEIRTRDGRVLTDHAERIAYLRDVMKMTDADAARIFRAVVQMSAVQEVEQEKRAADFSDGPSDQPES